MDTNNVVGKFAFMRSLVVEVGSELVGGLANLCFKIGYSSRETRRVALPRFKIGYVLAMYKDMEPTQCIKIGYSSAKYYDMEPRAESRLNVIR